MEKDNSVTLFRVDPETEYGQDLLKQAYAWQESYPRWYRKLCGNQSESEFIGALSGPEMERIAVFIDRQFASLLAISARGDGFYELHLYSMRNVHREKLADAVYGVGWELFEKGAREMYSWVFCRHKGALRLNRSCGMIWKGETKFENGAQHLRLSINREDWQLHRKVYDGQ